jgi:hypothetical protein
MGGVAKAYFGKETDFHVVMVHRHGSLFLLKRAMDI